jgi:hypothetical protein
MRGPDRATVVAKNSTKVRPVAQATKSTPTPSRRADDKAGSKYYDERAATADLSDSKHEDFGRSSGEPAQPICVAQLALTTSLESSRDAADAIRFSSKNFRQGPR